MKNLSFRFKFFAVLAVFTIAIAVETRLPTTSSATGTNVGVKIESVNPTTGSVTTEKSGITIVHDRGARLNFVPAKVGTNVGVGK
jgi:hypothetical protein